jgi:hypothetical protein
MAGLEPARLAPPPPQDGVSTNSTTSARTERHRITLSIRVPKSRDPELWRGLITPEAAVSIPRLLPLPTGGGWGVGDPNNAATMGARGGFSLDATVRIEATDRKGLERRGEG